MPRFCACGCGKLFTPRARQRFVGRHRDRVRTGEAITRRRARRGPGLLDPEREAVSTAILDSLGENDGRRGADGRSLLDLREIEWGAPDYRVLLPFDEE